MFFKTKDTILKEVNIRLVIELVLLSCMSFFVLAIIINSKSTLEIIACFSGQEDSAIDNKLLLEVIKITTSIIGAYFIYHRYLNDRKNKTITENRIEWMYRIRDYIIKLNNCLNEYIFSTDLSNKKRKELKINIQNHVDQIILYLAPEIKQETKKRSELDFKLEKALLSIKNVINNDSDIEIVIEKQKELLSIARIYFKIEWEKVKHEVKNEAQDGFKPDEHYEKYYK